MLLSGHEFETSQKESNDAQKEDKVIGKSDEAISDQIADEGAKKKSEFAKVSEDMTELVFHLNTIQNDISELAGRPISIVESKD